MNKQKSIVCVGLTPCEQRTLCFESLHKGEVNRAKSVVVSSSGKATNVARVLQTLGSHAVLTGFAGGPAGKQFLARLTAEGIPHSFVETIGPTRICQTLIDETDRVATELVEETPLPALGEWRRFHDIFQALLEHAELAIISGSPPPGSDPDVYAELIVRARQKNCRVWIDAQQEPFTRAIAARPWLAKLNRAELSRTVGAKINGDPDLARAARDVCSAGAEIVIVTDGQRPAWLVTKSEIHQACPPAIKPLNAIGSGDAMTAGMAHGLTAGQSLLEAFRLGMACGAANALTLTPGVVEPNAVDQLLAGVKLLLRVDEKLPLPE